MGTISDASAQITGPQPMEGAPSGVPPQPPPAMEEAAPLLVLPASRPFGFTHNETVDFSETFETNPLGIGAVGNTKNSADALTSLSLGLGLHDHTARFTGDLQYTLAGYAYANHGNYDQVYNYLNALVNAVLIPDYLVVNGSAFAAPMLMNALGPIAAPGLPVAEGVNSGAQNAYGYSIAPDLRFRLGDFARADSIVGNSALFFVAPRGPVVGPAIPVGSVPSQLFNYFATEHLSSGIDFSRLNWQLTGNATRTTEPGVEYRQISGVADLRYALSPEFALLGTGGYETFESNQPLNSPVTGPIALGGVELNLGPRFQASARAGEQFHHPSYVGDVNYQITAFTTFTALATDDVLTPAGALLGGLGQLGVNNQGDFYNTGYQPTQNVPPPTVTGATSFVPGGLNTGAINNVISRNRSYTATLLHIEDRTQYRLTAFWNEYESLIGPGVAVPVGFAASQRTAGGDFTVSRNINPFLDGQIGVDYYNQDILGGNLSLVQAYGSLSYKFNAFTQIYFRPSYIHRVSNAALMAASPFTGNADDLALTAGLRIAL